MRKFPVLLAAAFFVFATAARADDGAPPDPDCGHMQMQPDGSVVAPPGVDAGALDSARQAILIFPIDMLFDKLSAELQTRIGKDLEDAHSDAGHAAILRLKNDLPAILAVFKQDVVDAVATGIACHQTKSDIDVLVAFLRTSAGHKLIDAVVSHSSEPPALNDAEKADMNDFAGSDAGKRVMGEFADGSRTDTWMKAELAHLKVQITAWLQMKYGPGSIGGPV